MVARVGEYIVWYARWAVALARVVWVELELVVDWWWTVCYFDVG